MSQFDHRSRESEILRIERYLGALQSGLRKDVLRRVQRSHSRRDQATGNKSQGYRGAVQMRHSDANDQTNRFRQRRIDVGFRR